MSTVNQIVRLSIALLWRTCLNTVAAAASVVLIAIPGLARAQTPCTPTLLSPPPDAELDNGGWDRTDRLVWDFDWAYCEVGTVYHLEVRHLRALNPVVDGEVGTSDFHHECESCYVADQNRFNWIWRVRAFYNGQRGEWSETRRFSVEPAGTDPLPNCELRLNGSVFADGDQVVVQSARLANQNTSGRAVPVDALLVVELPYGSSLALMRVGQDGTLVLPPGFDQDFGPIPLATIQPWYYRGEYQIVCRLIDAATGALLSEHFNPFEIR